MTTAVLEFSRLMRRVAEPGMTPGELAAHAINRAARRLGISRRQAKRFWYGERKVVPADLMDRARKLCGEARDEFRTIEQRIARLEALLVADEDFYGAQVDALRQVHRHQVGAVDGGE